jgi:spermidine dehydrogenase
MGGAMKRTRKAKAGITRRDFLNAVLLGTGASLLRLPAPGRLLAAVLPRTGCGGLGDYATSHGNTRQVMQVLEAITKGAAPSSSADLVDTGEAFDLVIAGGGLSGLSAAHEFKKKAPRGARCLILENHPIFGGVAKRNEFVVNGVRLIAPQGSNSFGVLTPGIPGYEIYDELGVPRHFTYQDLQVRGKDLDFDRTNFGYRIWFTSKSIGYFFGGQGRGTGHWVGGIWENAFKGTPYPEAVRRDFLRWRNSKERFYTGEHYERWLDGMTYEQYLQKVMGLSPEVPRFAHPILASTVGLGCDVISAYAAHQVYMPGFPNFRGHRSLKTNHWDSFPGGNDGFSRFFIKALIPEAIEGKKKFEDIQNRPVRWAALDKPDNRVRFRAGASVLRVQHEGDPAKSEHVLVTYLRDGKAFRLKAGAVVAATGSYSARRIVQGLPAGHRDAFAQMTFAPMLIVNVALTNWRFLYHLGYTACRWFEGFGFSCNIRRPMVVGEYSPPLHPDKPIVLTFYVSFQRPGLPVAEQVERGRKELLETSYARYEERILSHLSRLFGPAGFNPETDVAGIILNRWLYGYVVPQPGFYFGTGDRPAPPDVIREPFGRISFGHADLNGHQHWVAATQEGRRAADQALSVL